MATESKNTTKSRAGAKDVTQAPQQEEIGKLGRTVGRGLPKVREGVVLSDKMEKTVVVGIGRQVRHSTYGKFVRRTRHYFAHDPEEKCGVGDVVKIVETRPLSKNKRWRVVEILRRAQ